MSKKDKKAKGSIFEEELVQSPGRTAAKNFMSRKLSVIAMFTFILIFVSCFALSLVFPIDLNYTDSTRMNLKPALNYLSVPKSLASNAHVVDLGSTYGAGVDKQGRLYLWGTLTDKLKSNIPQGMGRLKVLSCGYDHIVAINEDNQVFAWGNERLKICDVPDSIQGKNIVDLQAGYQVTIALDDEGNMYFWGNSSNFNIRLSTYKDVVMKDIALNVSTALALAEDGSVVCLSPADSQFKNIPESIQGRTVKISSTDNVGAAILDDGSVVTWGMPTAAERVVPDEIQGRVVDLDGGRTHFSALLDDGSVYSWGENAFNQISYPEISGYSKIYSGYYQNAAVDEDGNVAVWGQKGYVMGTDQWGRDVAKRLIHGGRISLTVGFASVLVSGFIGIIVGGISGYFGGRVDILLMRFAEVISAIPFTPLAVILSAIVQSKVSETGRVVMIMLILGLLNWPGLARITRAQILSEKENEFVTAAKAMGIREGAIIFKHILPNVLAVILVNLTLNMATCMLLESSLSFLGFGIIEPTPTWGNMLNKCVDSVVIANYWWRWVFPSIALGLCTISINIVGDGFRDAIDPKSGER